MSGADLLKAAIVGVTGGRHRTGPATVDPLDAGATFAYALTLRALVESSTASGLILDTRAAYNWDDVTPNPNDPVPPATVGASVATPGDPNGVVAGGESAGAGMAPSVVTPSPWSGWPAEWPLTFDSRLEDLTDIAWACLDLNADALATMPPYLVGASSSLPSDWLNNPDPDQYTSWEEFAKQLFWDFQIGEAFVLTTARYSNEFPARFHVVPPWAVNVDMDGSLRRYAIGGADVTGDMLHIRYQGTVGDAHGHGPLEAGRSRLIAANVLTRYATTMAQSGGIPNAVLKHPQNLNAQQAADLQSAWVQARMSIDRCAGGPVGRDRVRNAAAVPEGHGPRRSGPVHRVADRCPARRPTVPHGPPVRRGLDDVQQRQLAVRLPLAGRPEAAGADRHARPCPAGCTPRGTKLEVNRDEYVQAGTVGAGADRRDPQPDPRHRRESGDDCRRDPELRNGSPTRRPTELVAGVLR